MGPVHSFLGGGLGGPFEARPGLLCAARLQAGPPRVLRGGRKPSPEPHQPLGDRARRHLAGALLHVHAGDRDRRRLGMDMRRVSGLASGRSDGADACLNAFYVQLTAQ